MNQSFNYHSCNFCPRNCRIDRYLQNGFCKSLATPVVAKAALHQWEEPCISGVNGSSSQKVSLF